MVTMMLYEFEESSVCAVSPRYSNPCGTCGQCWKHTKEVGGHFQCGYGQVKVHYHLVI